MSNAFEQHARSNGGTVVAPRPVEDGPTPSDGAHTTWESIRSGNQTWQPASRVQYDDAMPGAVSSPLFHITVNQDTAGILEGESGRTDASAGGNDRSVDITRYIDRNIGGTTGVVINNGYTSGLNQYWNRHSFRGRAVQFEDISRTSDRGGPVGRINYGGNLQAGIDQQFSVMPSLEDIYRSIANRT